MLQRLENRTEKQETINTVNTFTKDIEKIKKQQTEMNNIINEIKNTLEGTNSRITVFLHYRDHSNPLTLS